MIFRLALASLLLVAPAPPKDSVTDAADLPNGTTLAIQLSQSVRADRSKPGNEVRAKLLTAVLVKGAIAVPAGATVLGVVVESAPRSAQHPSRLSIRFQRVQWRDGDLALNAYMTRQLVIKRSYDYGSREFCVPLTRLLPDQHRQIAQQFILHSPQQTTPPPPPPARPDTTWNDNRLNDNRVHDCSSRQSDNSRQLTFSSPALSGVSLRTLDKATGATLLESEKRNISLGKGMMWEIRHSALK